MLSRLLVAMVVGLVCTQAVSADATGKIVKIAVRYGKAYIKVEPAPATRPACATNGSYHYAFPVTDDNGKATFSMVMTAYTTKAKVSVQALETCTHYSGLEDVSYIALLEP